MLSIVLKKIKIPVKYKILWVNFIRTFLHLCVVDSFDSTYIWTEQVQWSSMDWESRGAELGACSNPDDPLISSV